MYLICTIKYRYRIILRRYFYTFKMRNYFAETNLIRVKHNFMQKSRKKEWDYAERKCFCIRSGQIMTISKHKNLLPLLKFYWKKNEQWSTAHWFNHINKPCLLQGHRKNIRGQSHHCHYHHHQNRFQIFDKLSKFS